MEVSVVKQGEAHAVAAAAGTIGGKKGPPFH